ncbi:type IV secretion system protein VirB2 [Sphingobium wenxiniae]|jgi:type IV secretion system protein VirB2|uniref:Conjugal transfer protein TrbC n=5 Tax=Sphingomonadaceae TaxID=41297 RepID=F6F482_SPHCR|nr:MULTISPECIES: TrbC/VirB2 family protein [Sphingomonadaceae]KEY97120.1 type VI secretion protein [Sphingomonas sp. BHC-A]MAP45191.1 type VI secretion protein [Sphingobium sp.]MBY2930380.1 TrbC/VirB2 family protein [Sphingomonadales bacterium 56]MBY2960456.1 TrbC/VirB2 family protein [Sphingomonadales bacterium 58]OJY59446.1 MAG: type VI secretion protein [Sphingobium sp. 66-54]
MTAITAHPGGRPQWARLLLRVIGVMALALLVSMLLSDPAHAQGADGITSMAENIKTWLTGTFAKTIAVIAVVIVGFMFFTGRASLGLLVTVIVGIFIVFSAQWIVDTITGGA